MTHDGAAFGGGLHEEQDFVAIVAIAAAVEVRHA
jgi:hypothetical protein